MRRLLSACIAVAVAIGLLSIVPTAYAGSESLESVAQSLEQKITALEAGAKTERELIELSNTRYRLGYLMGWKMGKPREAEEQFGAMAKYQVRDAQIKLLQTLAYIHMAELSLVRKDKVSAADHYRHFLYNAAQERKQTNDRLSRNVFQAFEIVANYRLSGIERPGAGGMKLDIGGSTMEQMAPYMSMLLVPQEFFDYPSDTDVEGYFARAPAGLPFELMSYIMLIDKARLNKSAYESFTLAYIRKFPDSMFSLNVMYGLIKRYRDEGRKERAREMLSLMVHTAQRLGVTAVFGMDMKYSSPEATWQTHKTALLAGNFEGAADCFAQDRREQYLEMYKSMGPENARTLANNMLTMEEVSSGDEGARYKITRIEKVKTEDGQTERDQEIVYYIFFAPIDGNWKIVKY